MEVKVLMVHRYYHQYDWNLHFVFVSLVVLIANFQQPKQNANENKQKKKYVITDYFFSSSFIPSYQNSILTPSLVSKFRRKNTSHTTQVRIVKGEKTSNGLNEGNASIKMKTTV